MLLELYLATRGALGGSIRLAEAVLDCRTLVPRSRLLLTTNDLFSSCWLWFNLPSVPYDIFLEWPAVVCSSFMGLGGSSGLGLAALSIDGFIELHRCLCKRIIFRFDLSKSVRRLMSCSASVPHCSRFFTDIFLKKSLWLSSGNVEVSARVTSARNAYLLLKAYLDFIIKLLY